MSRVHVGCQIRPQHCTTEQIIEGAKAVEAVGADIVFVWDHMYPLFGDPEGASFECYTLLGAIARETSRVRVGSLVAGNSYRNPDLHAYMVNTLDHLSNGRAILGIGSGWAQRDYDEYGYDFGTVGSRLRDLGEALPRIKARLGRLSPPPIGPVPILIGGGGEKVTLKLVAQYADMWHTFGDVERWSAKNRILNEWCEDVGRDQSQIERSCGADPANLDGAKALIDAGVQMLTVGIDLPGYDFDKLKPLVELAHSF